MPPPLNQGCKITFRAFAAHLRVRVLREMVALSFPPHMSKCARIDRPRSRPHREGVTGVWWRMQHSHVLAPTRSVTIGAQLNWCGLWRAIQHDDPSNVSWGYNCSLTVTNSNEGDRRESHPRSTIDDLQSTRGNVPPGSFVACIWYLSRSTELDPFPRTRGSV